MYYSIAILLLAVVIYFWTRKQKQQNFKQYAQLQVRVLLDQNNGDYNRQYGCFIFQLNCTNTDLKEVVLTEVQCNNKHFGINQFEKLNFFIEPGRKGESAMRSIGFSASNRFMEFYQPKQESILVKGDLKNRKGEKQRFIHTAYFKMEAFEQGAENQTIIKDSTLAV